MQHGNRMANALTPQSLIDQLAEFVRFDDKPSLIVAYSGGVDSVVLLHLLHRARTDYGFNLKACHVDHAIAAESANWRAQCAQYCMSIDVEFCFERVQWVDNAGRVSEDEARRVRYAWFRKQLKEKEWLLTAHHQRDQAETLLLHLMRGSGTRGLTAISKSQLFGKGHLIRPMLDFSKQQITDYAAQNQLPCIADPANESLRHDRNYLRHQVIPAIEARWHSAVRQIARSAALLEDAQSILDQVAQADTDQCKTAGMSLFCLGTVLSVDELERLDAARQCNLIRYWTRVEGLREPNRKSLAHLLDSILGGRTRYLELSGLHGYRICLYDSKLYLCQLHETTRPQEDVQWDSHGPITLNRMALRIAPGTGDLRTHTKNARPDKLTIRFRSGGERIVLPGRTHSSSLKKLLQQRRIPPWERSQLPLVFAGDKLIAVASWIYSDSWRQYFGYDRITVTPIP